MADKNPTRTCIGCKQTDDHPRHVMVEGGAEVTWHMDCHSLVTGCETCKGIVTGSDGVTGDKLRTYLTKSKG